MIKFDGVELLHSVLSGHYPVAPQPYRQVWEVWRTGQHFGLFVMFNASRMEPQECQDQSFPSRTLQCNEIIAVIHFTCPGLNVVVNWLMSVPLNSPAHIT